MHGFKCVPDAAQHRTVCPCEIQRSKENKAKHVILALSNNRIKIFALFCWKKCGMPEVTHKDQKGTGAPSVGFNTSRKLGMSKPRIHSEKAQCWESGGED